ncbi:MAG TPA: class II aldolase/adducin family protein [Alphaproteobacteria bacterium]|nr:class II aldolase/adducin family protein [Alphaproteobacteria bacterium]
MTEGELRQAVVDTVRRMNTLGINQGTAGNASIRFKDGMLITPSAMSYEAMTGSDIVWMRLSDGKIKARGNLQPSSEWRFHRDILAARDDVDAVVHTHGRAAATLSCLHQDIPAFHYMVAVAGGDSIRCAPYALFGTQELSDNAVAALRERKACLLANHGLIACDSSLDKALALALEVETLAEMYWRCLQVTRPAILSKGQMAEVLKKFQTYGQPR